MASPTLPIVTEVQLLTAFLLAPSPFPIIIPYTTFLTLIPQPYRSDSAYASALKRIYLDLQFQRSITVDQVRANIGREGGVRAATVRARLTRRIAIEEGSVKAEEDELGEVVEGRKRKRTIISGDRAKHNVEDEENDGEVKDEEFMESDDEEFRDPRELEAQRTFRNHGSMFHPAANVLPSEHFSKRRTVEVNAMFHTKGSLIDAMKNASRSLEKEIKKLEAECASLRDTTSETVYGLSDLRYGKSKASRDKDGHADEDGDGEYKEVLSALENFGGLVRSKTKSSVLMLS